MTTQRCDTLDDRIPLYLVTGFLGSGKTTFLKELVARSGERRFVYLVNEFSPQDIDGAIVSDVNPCVVAIPGGSIFCRCLVTEFIGQLSSIPDRFTDVEGVVIEASGMANPKVIGDMLHETGLDKRYILARIFSVVDPDSFLKLRLTLPNILAQVEAADTVLINKADLASGDRLGETRDAIHAVNPDAHIEACSYARINNDPFCPAMRNRPVHGEYARCKDPAYSTVTVHPARGISVAELRERLLAVEDEIYRAKGIVRSADRYLRIDYSQSGFSATVLQSSAPIALVLIMRGEPSPRVQTLIDWMREPATGVIDTAK